MAPDLSWVFVFMPSSFPSSPRLALLRGVSMGRASAGALGPPRSSLLAAPDDGAGLELRLRLHAVLLPFFRGLPMARASARALGFRDRLCQLPQMMEPDL